MMDATKFLELAERKVDENPQVIEPLLNMAVDRWRNMVDALRRERESSHRRIVANMAFIVWLMLPRRNGKPRPFTEIECYTLLDAADAIDPNGRGYSRGERELFSHLADSLRGLGASPDDDLIKNIRLASDILRKLYENYPAASSPMAK